MPLSKRVFIESDILIAYLKKSDWLKPIAKQILTMAQNKDITLVTSSATLLEIYLVFYRDQDIDLIFEAITNLRDLPIDFVQMDDLVVHEGCAISTEVGATPFDSIYMATAQKCDVSAILSTDNKYKIFGDKCVDLKTRNWKQKLKGLL